MRIRFACLAAIVLCARVAAADVLTAAQQPCSMRRSGDGCITRSGHPGICHEDAPRIDDPRRRSALTCDRIVDASVRNVGASPAPSAAPTTASRGCSTRAPSDGPISVLASLAVIAAARSARRASAARASDTAR